MCQRSSSEDLIDRHPWLLFSRGKIIELLTEYNHRRIFGFACLGSEAIKAMGFVFNQIIHKSRDVKRWRSCRPIGGNFWAKHVKTMPEMSILLMVTLLLPFF